jgi:hypothetical protein
MTSKSVSAVDVLAEYRELLRIVKNRPPCILTESETNKLIKYLEACIAEVETGTSEGLKGKELTG